MYSVREVRRKHWKDAVFRVPLRNVVYDSTATCLPLVGERVTVRHKRKADARTRMWKGVVVSELELLEERRLLETNDMIDDDALSESSGPPGCVQTSCSPQRKRGRIQGTAQRGVTGSIFYCFVAEIVDIENRPPQQQELEEQQQQQQQQQLQQQRQQQQRQQQQQQPVLQPEQHVSFT